MLGVMSVIMTHSEGNVGHKTQTIRLQITRFAVLAVVPAMAGGYNGRYSDICNECERHVDDICDFNEDFADYVDHAAGGEDAY